MDTIDSLTGGDEIRITPSELQAELDSLRSLRRRSLSQPADVLDPDLPVSSALASSPPTSPPSPTSPTSPLAGPNHVIASAIADLPSGLVGTSDTPLSDLMWLPAHLHPEIAPQEFKAFLREQTKPENLLRRTGSLNRQRSMLSRQYYPSERDGVEEEGMSETGLRTSTPRRTQTRGGLDRLTLEDLQMLEQAAIQASQEGEQGAEGEKQLKTLLRRSLSLGVTVEEGVPAVADSEADAPLVPHAPGSILRRAARTKVRKPTLQSDTMGAHRFAPSRRNRLTSIQNEEVNDGNLSSDSRRTSSGSVGSFEGITSMTDEGTTETADTSVTTTVTSSPTTSPTKLRLITAALTPRETPVLLHPQPRTPSGDSIIDAYSSRSSPSPEPFPGTSPISESPSAIKPLKLPIIAPLIVPNLIPPSLEPVSPSLKARPLESRPPETKTSSEGVLPSALPEIVEPESSQRYIGPLPPTAHLTPSNDRPKTLAPTRPPPRAPSPGTSQEELDHVRKTRLPSPDYGPSESSTEALRPVLDSGLQSRLSKEKKSGWARLGFSRSRDSTEDYDFDDTSSISSSASGASRKSKKEKKKLPDVVSEVKDARDKDSFFGGLFSKKRLEEVPPPLLTPPLAISPTASGMLSKEGRYLNFYRLPIHVERAVYRLSHIKLANPRRPLYEQVLISNLMFWYLSIINKPPNPTSQHPQYRDQNASPQPRPLVIPDPRLEIRSEIRPDIDPTTVPSTVSPPSQPSTSYHSVQSTNESAPVTRNLNSTYVATSGPNHAALPNHSSGHTHHNYIQMSDSINTSEKSFDASRPSFESNPGASYDSKPRPSFDSVPRSVTPPPHLVPVPVSPPMRDTGFEVMHRPVRPPVVVNRRNPGTNEQAWIAKTGVNDEASIKREVRSLPNVPLPPGLASKDQNPWNASTHVSQVSQMNGHVRHTRESSQPK